MTIDDNGPRATLADSRVDLIGMVRGEIPEPAYVPGCGPWLRKGKRYLVPAGAGIGKSLAATIIAVTIIEHGGSVVVIDVENGADEYARRLRDILAARDPDGTLTEQCRERLSYHAWPTLRLSWAAEQWAQAIGTADLVVFDSSKLLLSSVGLAEDKADDYSQFVSRLLMPLSRAEITTMVLDNTGYADGGRSRGTSAKSDLNEVVMVVRRGRTFSRAETGTLILKRERCRFPDIPSEVHIPVGGGVYGPPEVVTTPESDDDTAWKPTGLMERVSEALEQHPGLSKRELRAAVRGKAEYVDMAIEILINEGHVDTKPDGRTTRHFAIEPYREMAQIDDRVPRVPTVSPRVPDTNRVTVSHVSPPTKGDTDTNTNRVNELAARVPLAHWEDVER